MNNYAKGLAVGKNNIEMQSPPPPYTAIIRQVSENGTASSVLSLSSITTAIEVAAIGGPAFVKWITTTDTTASVIAVAGGTANYDHVVSSGTFRRFVVPFERTPTNDPIGSVQGINPQLGLYARVAVKTAGIASVLVTEY